MVKLGIIGFSEKNGHPYSFSAIVNGYNKAAFEKTQWLGILDYLEKRDPSEIASLDAKVTHIWTQEMLLSKEISECCNIDVIVSDYSEMIGMVDGVIIARDDFECHKSIAEPFLNASIPVFVDKPLTVSKSELSWYKPYYKQGLLMSCSGFKYCEELRPLRALNVDELAENFLVRTSVINGWEKYGIHMIDAYLGVFCNDKPRYVDCTKYEHFNSYVVGFHGGNVLQIDTMGPDIVTFSFDVLSKQYCEKFEIRNNFSAFRNTLEMFIKQVKTKKPAISWEEVAVSMTILIAGIEAREANRKVDVNYEC